jgi:prepilin-type N-terminal cleavage/methylation domain-containing protein
MTRKGFTLIELLIVVAIIAILAAIAVPNFLEAQTRSKVGRCKADMRSLATALEAYFTDNNDYPTYHYVNYSLCTNYNEFFIGGSFVTAGVPLPFDGNPLVTTPISYISSMPKDPFYVGAGDSPPEAFSFMFVNFPYFYHGTTPSDIVLQMYGMWRITSGGPDKSRAHAIGDSFHILYDPSNGTISIGQIHRTQRSPDGIPIDPW